MKVEFNGEVYVVKFTHNTIDNFVKNLNLVYGNPKMGVHTATGKDLNNRRFNSIFRPLMKHFKYQLGTFCMIKKFEENNKDVPTFALEDPLAFEFARLSKKDSYVKKIGRKEALQKAMRVMFPNNNKSFKAFQKLVVDKCANAGKKKLIA